LQFFRKRSHLVENKVIVAIARTPNSGFFLIVIYFQILKHPLPQIYWIKS